MKTTPFVWTVLLVMILVALIAYAIVKVRRSREEHRARSDERAAAMLLAMHQESAKPRPAAPAQSQATAPAHPMPSRQPAGLKRRPRLLDERQRLLYLVLRAALTDHVIMANIRVADLVDTAAASTSGNQETRLQRLLHERIDCVVCNGELVPIAAVMVYDPTGVPSLDERIKVDALRELGVKFLRFRADDLPKPAQMRGHILS
jgi:cytochrome c-type biogenesis protein CcmH/NrfF